ncbi:YciI family protein [Micromonospora sp. WMMD961]|uniref:YciI family protein n=1 Tax=Micromonospora sp. WMMD961 TaxID=3016100 RepID=UPI002416200F|nr:YciI family protein [Micromonospora sp. WMMD961]MDG4779352.1 YciI family protein [Micromonospora sp. WMMD961]
MFILELSFGDEPDRLAARPAHRERLQALRQEGRLVMAGPFSDDSGALLIFDVADAEAFAAILAEDPYYRTPGVTIVGQREWSPIVG